LKISLHKPKVSFLVVKSIKSKRGVRFDRPEILIPDLGTWVKHHNLWYIILRNRGTKYI